MLTWFFKTIALHLSVFMGSRVAKMFVVILFITNMHVIFKCDLNFGGKLWKCSQETNTFLLLFQMANYQPSVVKAQKNLEGLRKKENSSTKYEAQSTSWRYLRKTLRSTLFWKHMMMPSVNKSFPQLLKLEKKTNFIIITTPLKL